VTDDRELFLCWAGGDRDAGQQLVLRHYDAVYFFFASKLPDEAAVELTQDTFETMCKQASSLRIHSSFASYLFGIARWKLVEHFRRQSKQGFDPLSDSFPDPQTASSITAWLGRRRAESTLIQALRQLPLDDQLLLDLRLYEGLQLREIAEILGMAKEGVAARLAQAKRRLRRAAEGLAPAEDTLTTLSSYMRGVRAELARNLEEAADGGDR
jgi:RNA polymerase sigma factor (sigma-70 family)